LEWQLSACAAALPPPAQVNSVTFQEGVGICCLPCEAFSFLQKLQINNAYKAWCLDHTKWSTDFVEKISYLTNFKNEF
jgi:hypothetical protein